jgi:hypothetical protein
MKNFNIKNLAKDIVRIIIFLFVLNFINLIFELFKVNFHIENIAFQEGYFVLNDKQIGNNIFSISIIIVIYIVVLLYRYFHKNKSV